jgi:chitodextrinase
LNLAIKIWQETYFFLGRQAQMQRYFSFRVKLAVVFLSIMALFGISATSSSVLNSYSPALRRYPYLTDVVASYATINWGTDRSETSGGVRFGKLGSEACTAHYVSATKTPISVNGVNQYQWKAQLELTPGTQYCYRVYLGTSPVNEIDLLGSDLAPSFWTQMPSGGNQSFSFIVFGDWGQVDAAGQNQYQASLMSLMASSGARFVVTTGDNGYPDGNQKNLGDLVQVGQDISAVFGPSFWKVPGASLPIFPTLGDHGFSSPDTNHPQLITWPQDRAVSLSQGRYAKETYCCLDGTTSATYPSAWYAFDAGPARFYILNATWDEANIGTASQYQVDYDYHWAPGTDQYEWLKADLQNHSSVLKFAFWHFPVYSDNPFETTDTFLQGSNSLEGLLKQYGVDLGFTGHAHIYERNLASPSGIPNYISGGGGAEPGTLGTCTALDAYAIKFTTTGKACGSAPVPTSAGQIYHFLKVTVNGTNVNVTPINSLGQTFDVMNYTFSNGSEATAPTTPTNLTTTAGSGTQIDLTWSASSDNTEVRGYSIYRDGVLVNTVPPDTLQYSDTGLIPATSYNYRVDAFDGSGNHSNLSASKSATTSPSATYTFAPVADTYVSGDFPTTNFGTSALLKADTTPVFQSYLRFNVGDISGTVTGATLRLYTTSSSAVGYQIKRVNNQGWEEGSLTLDVAPAPGTVIGSSGNFAMGSWTSVDVSALVTGPGIYDFALTTASTATLNFNSREAGSNQPQLVVETTTGVPPSSGDMDTTGVFRPSNGLLYLKNSNTTGIADVALNYGLPGDYPVVGDWNGDGTATIGIYRDGYFYLRNSNTIGFADIVFPFGQPGDQPIAGDWNGDGTDTIGVYRPSTGQFLLRNSNSAGAAAANFFLGNPGDVGVAGDWDGDGKDTTGVFRPSDGVIFLKNNNTTGIADIALNYGLPGDQPVMGDWNNDGLDTIGIYRQGTFYLRNENTNGFAEIVFGLGNPGDVPIAGNWDGTP